MIDFLRRSGSPDAPYLRVFFSVQCLFHRVTGQDDLHRVIRQIDAVHRIRKDDLRSQKPCTSGPRIEMFRIHRNKLCSRSFGKSTCDLRLQHSVFGYRLDLPCRQLPRNDQVQGHFAGGKLCFVFLIQEKAFFIFIENKGLVFLFFLLLACIFRFCHDKVVDDGALT